MLMLLLKRLNVPLVRDVIFLLAESGEEATPHVGIDFMVAKHWEEIEAEYCLAEGGSVTVKNGRVQYVSIATTERFRLARVSSLAVRPDTGRSHAKTTPWHASRRLSRRLPPGSRRCVSTIRRVNISSAWRD